MTNLSKVYRTEFLETFAPRDFSIDVKEGEFVAITGPSGSGKTTFLNIAGILEGFTTGEYLLDGVNVRDMNDDQRSRLRNEKIGFIFQAFNLILDLSVFANVELRFLCETPHSAEGICGVGVLLGRVDVACAGSSRGRTTVNPRIL